MSDAVPSSLHAKASFGQQKKRAKDLLKAYRAGDATARERMRAARLDKATIRLADAQLLIARELGFTSWTGLKHALEKTDTLHAAAARGDLAAVNALMSRGADPNARDGLDKATPLHFAAGGGYLPVVQALLDAGADVHGEGDDHELGVLGWATCFRSYHEAVARLLLARGARHHIFTAIATDDRDWVRRAIVSDHTLLTRKMSRNEHHRLPLHLAVFKNRREMVELLLELGADPHVRDAAGSTALGYATARIDPGIIDALRAAGCELGLLAALRMRRYDLADALMREDPARLGTDGSDVIALHLCTFDRDLAGVRWLIEHGVDVNAKRTLWDCNHTALHVCAEHDIRDVARLLLDAGADPEIKDDKYQSNVLGWAEFCRRRAIAKLLSRVHP